MEFRDGEVVFDKPPNDLDRLVLDVTDVLDRVGVEYVVVSGYVAVLFGRSRATEDVDVLVEPFDESTAEALATGLADAGYWGAAMPLAGMYETLDDGLPVRIAEDGHRVPNVELKFATDEFDRLSLTNRVTVRLGSERLHVVELELQIAYKLRMGAQRDIEDALYLYELATGHLDETKLARYAERLDVRDEYDHLRDDD